MSNDLQTYVHEVQAIGAVSQILETVSSLTGLGFVAVAHVAGDSWTACAVLDKLGFGLKVGDGLDVTTTLCEEVRDTGKSIIIDHVQKSQQYCNHHTPRIYGFQSYFSVPIFRPDGAYFGTLCGLDPAPKTLSSPSIVSTLELFAQLISKQLEVEQGHVAAQKALLSERETSELREQFIAVLGHDLRTPLSALQHGIEVLRLKHADPNVLPLLQLMERSVDRISALVDDVVDFTRGRMGGGITLKLANTDSLEMHFNQVIAELCELHPEITIAANIQPNIRLFCDIGRLSQLLSNLLKNSIVHGDAQSPVEVSITSADGQFVLSVSNKGNELPPQVIQQLFKPFWRAPNENRSHHGLGLGLYIVAEIARSHKGTMDVTSRDGTTCFTFSMPNHIAASDLAAN